MYHKLVKYLDASPKLVIYYCLGLCLGNQDFFKSVLKRFKYAREFRTCGVKPVSSMEDIKEMCIFP